MQAAKMSEFFDVDLNSNLDGDDYDNSAPVAPFEQKVEDAQSMLDPAPVPEPKVEPKAETDTDIITKAINSPSPEPATAAPSDSDDLEIPGDIESEVDADIAQFQSSIENATENEPTPESTENESEVVAAVSAPTDTPDDSNPLGLEGADLKAYYAIKEKYPEQFNLYDGSLAYRDFYRFKVHALRHLLGEFPLLDIREMRTELHTVQTNHFIGDDMCTPDLIRSKLDASYAYRTRLAALLTRALEQSHAWERFLDLLRSKLWKDHDIKGAWRRDGMVLEHVADMESYVSSLKGFIDSAKQYDSMLKAAAESLSRQLTCLQIDEYTGSQRVEGRKPQSQRPAPQLDGLDGVDDGTVIKAPVISKDSVGVATVRYEREDEFSQLG